MVGLFFLASSLLIFGGIALVFADQLPLMVVGNTAMLYGLILLVRRYRTTSR